MPKSIFAIILLSVLLAGGLTVFLLWGLTDGRIGGAAIAIAAVLAVAVRLGLQRASDQRK